MGVKKFEKNQKKPLIYIVFLSFALIEDSEHVKLKKPLREKYKPVRENFPISIREKKKPTREKFRKAIRENTEVCVKIFGKPYVKTRTRA